MTSPFANKEGLREALDRIERAVKEGREPSAEDIKSGMLYSGIPDDTLTGVAVAGVTRTALELAKFVREQGNIVTLEEYAQATGWACGVLASSIMMNPSLVDTIIDAGYEESATKVAHYKVGVQHIMEAIFKEAAIVKIGIMVADNYGRK